MCDLKLAALFAFMPRKYRPPHSHMTWVEATLIMPRARACVAAVTNRPRFGTASPRRPALRLDIQKKLREK
jgi:hypothetical protein